ncbi:UpxY family transcription antiterminator [Aureibaculum conchae]|uniref:UpxY family transcription antiterminator n=1 Tax=Aureibaculum sp. 2308TA14-22 TaxID=3108392 RepID=UPI0033949572
MLDSKPNHWYAIYTRARAEKKVYEQLLRSGYEAYLPLVTTVRQWSDRKKKVKTPLISSYVFIKIEEAKLINALSVYGAVRILKYLGKNAIVKDQEIQNLKLLLNNNFNVKPVRYNKFDIGDNVEVVSGTLSGLKGIVIKEKNKHNLFVKIQALNRYLRAEIPLNSIKKVIN